MGGLADTPEMDILSGPSSGGSATGQVPRFLQRIFSEEERRVREKTQRGTDGTPTTECDSGSSTSLPAVARLAPSASGGSTECDDGVDDGVDGSSPSGHSGHQPAGVMASSANSSTGAGHPPLQLVSYSTASSASSSEPASLSSAASDQAGEWRPSQYAYSPSDTSSSLSFSRGASPKSATHPLPSTPFGLSYSAHQHHPQGPQPPDQRPSSSFSQSPQTTPQHLRLQDFALPPPSLDLPYTPTSPLSTPENLLGPALAISTGTFTTSSTVTNSSDENEADALDFDDGSLLHVPENFAIVYPDVYRSSFPSKKHYQFLSGLSLKTVLTLVQEDYPERNKAFFNQNGIRFLQIGLPGNKEPFVCIPDEKLRKALSIVLDKRNHPLLIHCNKGKHRTGCLVGCLRKMQCWSSTAIFDEYRRFSYPKSRAMDQLFIELFQPDWTCVDARNLPEWCLGEDGVTSPIKTGSTNYYDSSTSSSMIGTPMTSIKRQ